MSEHGRPQEVESALGTCPDCTARIPAGFLLIRYEAANGGPRMFAECPDCGAVVHPG